MDPELINLLGTYAPTAVIFLISLLILSIVRKNRDRQQDYENKSKESEKEIAKQLKHIQEQAKKLNKKQSHFQEKSNVNLLNNIQQTLAYTKQKETTGNDYGGYIALDLPNHQRGIFQDLFKGFEDFAELRGYSIAFSVDNSVPNKVSFKFTIQDTGVIFSPQTVWDDLKDYLERIKNGDNLDNLPIFIPTEKHKLVLTTLKNRINFLKSNYHLQKNVNEFYEGLIDKFNTPNSGIATLPPLFLDTEKSKTSDQVLLHNTPKDIEFEDITGLESRIDIGQSFVDRKKQVEDLEEFIDTIKRDDSVGDKKKEKLVLNLEKVKSEIVEESEPDKTKVKKWLEKAKSIFDDADFQEEVMQLRDNVYDSFNFEL